MSLHYFSYLSQAQKALYFKLGQALGRHQIPCGAPAADINTAIKALLMAQRKIDCILVEGTLDGRMKHVWNMIRLEGQWLHVDVTMGYPFFRQLVGAADAYGGYLKTTAEISRSHTIYHPEMLPQERQEGTHGTRSM